jgi:hypothetical protein
MHGGGGCVGTVHAGALSAEELAPRRPEGNARQDMIRKLKSGEYRLYSRKQDPLTRKRRNLGTFKTLAAAKQHEREIQFFKRRQG